MAWFTRKVKLLSVTKGGVVFSNLKMSPEQSFALYIQFNFTHQKLNQNHKIDAIE